MKITKLPFTITEDSPSSIVADYDKFLSHVQAPTSSLTKSKLWLSRATLYSLNQDVKTENVEATSKTDQIFYPLLNFFYHISLAARFFHIDKVHNKYKLQRTSVVSEYQQLSAAEKYFALFEAFWVYTDWVEMLKENAYLSEFNIPQEDEFIESFCDIPVNKEVSIGQILKCTGHFRLTGAVHIVRILSFFGLLTYKLKSLSAKEQYSKGYIELKSLTISTFGGRFFELLNKERPFTLWNMPVRHFDGVKYPGQDLENIKSRPKAFAEPFNLMLNPESVVHKGLPTLSQENLNGTFTFKVAIDGTWRTISLSGKNTLDDLHLAIQEVYNFKDDHLYSFSFDPQRLHPKKSYHSPDGSECPYANEVTVGQLNLYVGQKLMYVFDYGDWWEFSIEVISITREPHFGSYKLLQLHGVSPEQYPEFDDDEDWE